MKNQTNTIVEVLNTLAKTNPEALRELINFRVPIINNDDIVDHPTVQFSTYRPEDKETGYSLGVLGLLQAAVSETDQLIVMHISDNGRDENYHIKPDAELSFTLVPKEEYGQ